MRVMFMAGLRLSHRGSARVSMQWRGRAGWSCLESWPAPSSSSYPRACGCCAGLLAAGAAWRSCRRHARCPGPGTIIRPADFEPRGRRRRDAGGVVIGESKVVRISLRPARPAPSLSTDPASWAGTERALVERGRRHLHVPQARDRLRRPGATATSTRRAAQTTWWHATTSTRNAAAPRQEAGPDARFYADLEHSYEVGDFIERIARPDLDADPLVARLRGLVALRGGNRRAALGSFELVAAANGR